MPELVSSPGTTNETAASGLLRLPRIQGRIPSVDGLRAMAIGMVLLDHLNGTRRFFWSGELNRWSRGIFGVRASFVISGFLITTLLLKEEDRYGTISLSRFYLRRFFRIFPAFYALCAVLVVLDRAGVIAFHPRDLLAAVTYTMNYHHDRAWYAGHLWSLSVEQQFYLMWPAVLLFLGVRRGLMAAAAVVLIVPPLRLATGFVASLRPGVGETFQTVADSLATGCLLAGLGPWLAQSPRWRRLLDWRWFWWTVPLAVAACARNPSAKLDWLIGTTVMNIGIALMIARAIHRPDDHVGRLLNSRPLVWIGTISYSLYLWQQVFINRHSTSLPQSFPLNLALTLLVAVCSYYLIERPFLRLRARLERSRRPAPPPTPAPAALGPSGGAAAAG